MSIEAAKKQLVKEIDSELARLATETKELTQFRTSVLSGSLTAERSIRAFSGRKAAKKAVARKASAKKAASHKTSEPKKRKLSAAGRKAISEAAKRRWADK